MTTNKELHYERMQDNVTKFGQWRQGTVWTEHGNSKNIKQKGNNEYIIPWNFIIQCVFLIYVRRPDIVVHKGKQETKIIY